MKKIIIPIFILMLVLSMSSCKNEITEIPNDNINENGGATNTDNKTEENNGSGDVSQNDKLESNYVSTIPTIFESDKPSAITDVEMTVEAVYDSVVSINVKAEGFTGSGSGVLFGYDENLGLSYIVTCFHVIEDCYSFEVVLANGDIYEAELVAGYDNNDIAVLSIEKLGLTYASLYDNSDNLKLGSTVVAIGNPLGTLPGSVSSGIISYLNRKVQVDEYNTMNLIQTDVAINSGNSGGGLFNTSGNLIGIVNAKYTDEGIEGLGFAIPINSVKNNINDFLRTATYDKENKTWNHGYIEDDFELGFSLSDGYLTSGGFFGDRTRVVYISALSPNETTSGYNMLEKEDIVNSILIDYVDSNKTDITIGKFTSAYEILNTIYTSNVTLGDSLILTITRNNTQFTITVEIVQYIY